MAADKIVSPIERPLLYQNCGNGSLAGIQGTLNHDPGSRPFRIRFLVENVCLEQDLFE
jgi:hypothetical protein